MNLNNPKYDSYLHSPVRGVVIGDSNFVDIEYPTSPFLAPPKPPYPLIGHDKDLNKLKDQLLAGDNVVWLSLNGLPGVGKTALAVELAHDKDVREHFVDGVLWAGLGRNADPFHHLGIWMAALGFPDDVIANTNTCEERKQSLQRVIGTRRILLVVDDAWKIEDADWFKVGGPNCAHLLTTQQPEIALDFAGKEGRTTVYELSLEDSLFLLKEFAREVVEQEPEEAKELVIAIGRLPIALVLMGKYLRKASYKEPGNIRQAIERLKSNEERVRTKQIPSTLQFHPGIEGASISLYTVSAMTDEALNEEARTVLRRLAVFAAKPNTFSEEAALYVTTKPAEYLDTLYDYGVLEGSKDDRHMIHQTISDYAALKLGENTEEEQNTLYRHSTYFAEFLEQRETQLEHGIPKEPLNDIEIEMPNIRLMWKRALGQKQDEILQKASDGLQLFYLLRGWYHEGEKAFGQAVTTFEEYIDKKHAAQKILMLAARMGLFQGRFLQFLGEHNKAKQVYIRSLEIQKNAIGKEHPDVATSLNSLATLYEIQGKYAETEQYYKQALEIRKKMLGPKHVDVATSLNDLARLYHNMGRYTEAEQLFLVSLEIRQNKISPDLAALYNNLAALYRSQGKNEEAQRYYQKSLEMWENVLGEENPYVATLKNNLGELYQSEGKYVEAETFYLESLEMRKKLFGEEHLDVAQSLHNLAGLNFARGKADEAEVLYKESLRLREIFLGQEHPDVAVSLSNLAELYRNQGKYKEAESLCKRSLAIREKVLGHEHLDVAASLNNLALVYYFQGKFTDVEPLYQRSLKIRAAILGMEHPDVAQSLNNLAGLYYSLRRYAEAETLFIQSLKIQEKSVGMNHPDTAILLSNVAEVYRAQGKYTEANQFDQKALEIAESLKGLARQLEL